jgi:hypothetical protein
MQASITKYAPQAIVLVVALYWSWPALKAFTSKTTTAAANTAAKKPAGVQEFAATTLSPTFVPRSGRNPFLSVRPQQTTAGAGKPGQKGTAAKAGTDVRDHGLVLNATFVAGRQRMAIINGRVYKEKETIPRPGEETPSCVVTGIFPHKVLLSYQGETLQLSYLNPAAKPAAGDDPQKSVK